MAKDLVSVRSDGRDGRAQIVALKASGRRVVPRLAALADENDAEAFGHLDQAQRASLLATLKALVQHLSWMQALPRMEAHVLSAGHKLLETHGLVAASLMTAFLKRRLDAGFRNAEQSQAGV